MKTWWRKYPRVIWLWPKNLREKRTLTQLSDTLFRKQQNKEKKCTKSGTLGGALSQAYSVSWRMLRIIQRACTASPVAGGGEDEEGKGKAGEKMVGADGVTAIIMYAMKCACQLTPPSPTSSLCFISLDVSEMNEVLTVGKCRLPGETLGKLRFFEYQRKLRNTILCEKR